MFPIQALKNTDTTIFDIEASAIVLLLYKDYNTFALTERHQNVIKLRRRSGSFRCRLLHLTIVFIKKVATLIVTVFSLYVICTPITDYFMISFEMGQAIF